MGYILELAYSALVCSVTAEAEYQAVLQDVLRFNSVTNINQPCLGVDAQDHPFHSGDIGISQSKIGGQGYDSSHYAKILRPMTETMINSIARATVS